MPTTTQLASLVVGLALGNVAGVYLAQTYELPDLHTFAENLFSKAKEYEKTTRKSDDGKEWKTCLRSG